MFKRIGDTLFGKEWYVFVSQERTARRVLKRRKFGVNRVLENPIYRPLNLCFSKIPKKRRQEFEQCLSEIRLLESLENHAYESACKTILDDIYGSPERRTG